MTDIRTVWTNGYGDWQIADGALAADDDLATATYLSLFTDAEASADDELPDGSSDRRGWWGDQGETIRLGSKLWLLSRSKLTTDVAKLAKIYAQDALSWMTTDSIASSVTATTTIVGTRQLNILITIERPSGTSSYEYAWAWNQLA